MFESRESTARALVYAHESSPMLLLGTNEREPVHHHIRIHIRTGSRVARLTAKLAISLMASTTITVVTWTILHHTRRSIYQLSDLNPNPTPNPGLLNRHKLWKRLERCFAHLTPGVCVLKTPVQYRRENWAVSFDSFARNTRPRLRRIHDYDPGERRTVLPAGSWCPLV